MHSSQDIPRETLEETHCCKDEIPEQNKYLMDRE